MKKLESLIEAAGSKTLVDMLSAFLKEAILIAAKHNHLHIEKMDVNARNYGGFRIKGYSRSDMEFSASLQFYPLIDKFELSSTVTYAMWKGDVDKTVEIPTATSVDQLAGKLESILSF